MVRDKDFASLVLEDFPAKFVQSIVCPQQHLSRYPPEAENDFRLDDVKLFPEIRNAGLHL